MTKASNQVLEMLKLLYERWSGTAPKVQNKRSVFFLIFEETRLREIRFNDVTIRGILVQICLSEHLVKTCTYHCFKVNKCVHSVFPIILFKMRFQHYFPEILHDISIHCGNISPEHYHKWCADRKHKQTTQAGNDLKWVPHLEYRKVNQQLYWVTSSKLMLTVL